MSTTARGLTVTPDLVYTLQDVSLQLSLVDASVLVPYLLDGFPGIVLLQRPPCEDSFEAKLVNRTAALEGFAGQFLVELARHANENLAGIGAHFVSPDIDLIAYYHAIAAGVEGVLDAQVQREFTHGDLQLAGIIEGVLFASDAPVTEAALLRVLRKRRGQIRAALVVLTQEYQHPGRGLRLEAVAGAYSLTTKPEHYEVLASFVNDRKEATKLSKAAIETLALIAMRQPMSAEEIKDIRGVESSGPLQILLKRGLITRAYGQSDGGKVFRYRPTHYRTTRQFLIGFGLDSPDDFREAEPFKSYFDEIHRSLAHDAWLRCKEVQSAGGSKIIHGSVIILCLIKIQRWRKWSRAPTAHWGIDLR